MPSDFRTTAEQARALRGPLEGAPGPSTNSGARKSWRTTSTSTGLFPGPTNPPPLPFRDPFKDGAIPPHICRARAPARCRRAPIVVLYGPGRTRAARTRLWWSSRHCAKMLKMHLSPLLALLPPEERRSFRGSERRKGRRYLEGALLHPTTDGIAARNVIARAVRATQTRRNRETRPLVFKRAA